MAVDNASQIDAIANDKENHNYIDFYLYLHLYF